MTSPRDLGDGLVHRCGTPGDVEVLAVDTEAFREPGAGLAQVPPWPTQARIAIAGHWFPSYFGSTRNVHKLSRPPLGTRLWPR
jgi:hypothetical protein